MVKHQMRRTFSQIVKSRRLHRLNPEEVMIRKSAMNLRRAGYRYDAMG